MDRRVRDILMNAIYEQEPFMEQPLDFSGGDDTELYSIAGQLDSLSLITIIADVERQLFNVLGIKVKLANEQNLAFENSPFKTFGTMLSFIHTKVDSAQRSIVV